MYSPDLTSLISPIERGLSAPGPSTLIPARSLGADPQLIPDFSHNLGLMRLMFATIPV